MFVENYHHEKVWFWSDLHLGHGKEFIWKARGFSSVQEHDIILEERFQAVVPKDASVWFLGDMIFGPNAEQRLTQFLERINGFEIVMLPGNHYSGLKSLKQSRGRKFELNNKLVRIVSNYEELRVGNQGIVTSHYPLLSWNGMGKGSFHIFGHVHGRIAQGLKNGQGLGKMIDVGVESCPEPISFREVQKIMEKKPYSNIDHHGPGV